MINIDIDLYNEKNEIINKWLERDERYLASKYVEKTDNVLELGARYGGVSIITNFILDNKKNHVCVEPDERIWDSLEKNKNLYNCQFNILKGVISNKKLGLTNLDKFHGGYGAFTIEDEKSNIINYSLEEVKKKFNIENFTVLIADCEGFLETFINENLNILSELRIIIFELDRQNKCNYNNINNILIENNFIKVYLKNNQAVYIKNYQKKNYINYIPTILDNLNYNYLKIDSIDFFPHSNAKIIKISDINYKSEKEVIDYCLNICCNEYFSCFVKTNDKIYFRKNNFEDLILNYKVDKNILYSILIIPINYHNNIISNNIRLNNYFKIDKSHNQISNGINFFDLENNLNNIYIDEINHLKKHNINYNLHNIKYLNYPIISPTNLKYNSHVYLHSFLRDLSYNKNTKFNWTYADLTNSFDYYKFVKARPIHNPNKSILLPLLEQCFLPDRIEEIKNDISFLHKINKIVWRGTNSGNKPNDSLYNFRAQRINLVSKFYNYKTDIFDIGFSDMRYSQNCKFNQNFIKKKLTIEEQLKYKFIIAIEGNDYATNLGWILLSNSILILPKPFIESWLCEKYLKEWIHYVPIKNDFSDLEENYKKCVNDKDLCLKLVINKKIFAYNLMNKDNEFLLAQNVCSKYLRYF